jgi:hypothetical protein
MQRANLKIESPSAAGIPAEPILAWKVHLLRDTPSRLLLIVPVVLAGLLISFLITHSLLFPAIALVIFAGALSDYLFPTRYEIGEKGARSRTIGGSAFIEWSRVKKYYLDDRGIKLSPLATPGRLEAYRGVYLRFGGNRDAVIKAVRRMRDALPADSRGS